MFFCFAYWTSSFVRNVFHVLDIKMMFRTDLNMCQMLDVNFLFQTVLYILNVQCLFQNCLHTFQIMGVTLLFRNVFRILDVKY